MGNETFLPAAHHTMASWRARLGLALNYAALIAWAVLTILIFAWLVESSFKTNREVFGSPWAPPSMPMKAAAANYTKAWSTSHMNVYFRNSVIVSIASVSLVILVSAPAAYALSRVPFFGRTIVNYYFIAGMGLPIPLILVPLFVLLSRLGLVNTLQGLILPGHLNPTNMIGTGLQLLLDHPEHWQRLREHPESIPQAVEEIIRFDGSIRSFGRITTREVSIGGVTLPENAPLLLIYGSGNRDELFGLWCDAQKSSIALSSWH